MTERPILASGSSIRRSLLEGAGLTVDVEPADIDERALEKELEGQSPVQLAEALAVAKAVHVSKAHPDSWVIGADQVLDHEGVVLHKAPSTAAAADKLHRLQGSVHHLTSAAALVKNGKAVWTGHDSAALTMRLLNPEAISAYLAKTGDAATQSVGAYRLEELGAALFERIDGDYFTILGLPLLPLLAALRDQGFDPIGNGSQP